MNPIYSDLPVSVNVSGINYPIYTDFRQWIRLSDMIGDNELSDFEKGRITMMYFTGEKPTDKEGAVRALADFYIMAGYPRFGVKAKNEKTKNVFSFKYDGGNIISAFRQVYGINLLDGKYMHWWEFNMLMEGLPDECRLRRIIAYRCAEPSEISDSKERKRIIKIQQSLKLPSAELSDNEIGNVFGL